MAAADGENGGPGAMSSTGNFMPLVGGIILIAVGAYFGFQGIDALGLEQKAGTAVVVSKEHVPAKKTYRTDYIAGRPRVIPQFVPDTYLINLRLDGIQTAAAVDKSLFDVTNTGDQIAVTYQQRRITGALQISHVRSGVH